MTSRTERRFGRRVPPPSQDVAPAHAALRGRLDDAIGQLEIYRHDDARLDRRKETPIKEIRRRGFRPEDDRLGTMSLIDDDGVLRWRPSWIAASDPTGRRRRRGRREGPSGTVVDQLRFERLDKSQVGGFLQRVDQKINPALVGAPTGKLRTLTQKLNLGKSAVSPVPTGRILLIVHGTFSHSENLHEAITHGPEGKALLARARSRYDQVLFYDHATLQVSPVMNAVDLDRAMRGTDATVDVVCHSRGGLVTRWWVETLMQDWARVGTVVFVGSPLAGTSLAAPPKLREALDYLTNVFDVLSRVTSLVRQVEPMMLAVTGLFKVLSSATRVAAHTPLFDIGLAAVPGLAVQSRVGDNPEIGRLRLGRMPIDRYRAVLSNFEPDPVGWRFWRVFQDPGQRLSNVAADLLFQDPNDLVVDTRSMTDLKGKLASDLPIAQVHDFRTNGQVHHLNYFHHPDTIGFLRRQLRL